MSTKKALTPAERKAAWDDNRADNPAKAPEPCEHERLDEDGICRTCGGDRRTGRPAVPAQVAEPPVECSGCELCNPTDEPAAQPVSAPSPEIPDAKPRPLHVIDKELSGWSRGYTGMYIQKLEKALRAVREERDRLVEIIKEQDKTVMYEFLRYKAERESRKQEAVEHARALEALRTVRDSTAVLNHLDRKHIDMIEDVFAKSVSGSPERLEGGK